MKTSIRLPRIYMRLVLIMSLIAVLLVASMALVSPSFAATGSVHARFDLSTPQEGPFPSDGFTIPDSSQNTGLRVRLPKPDCAARPSDCEDLDVINELDGFNLQPRLSIPFDGPINVASVSSQSVFLVSLGSMLIGGDPGGRVVGIDQVVWDTFTNTLHVESDELLDQYTGYVLVVTKKVLDTGGKEVKAAKMFIDFIDESNSASTGDPALDAYRTLLRNALTRIDAAGVIPRGQVVAASVFTTRSATADLEKMRDQIKAATPAPADFLLGPGGSRTVFYRSSVTSLRFSRQVRADLAAPLSSALLRLSNLDVVPGAVGTIAFGKYSSTDYRVHPGEFIPVVGTLTGTPLVQGTNQVTFLLVLPSSPPPADGYPVAIYSHGGSENKASSALVAATLAEHGIATIAIDAPGGGFGPLSTYSVTFTDSSSVTFPSGGRGIDQNGDGQIADGEGFSAMPPQEILGGRDGHRQWVVDHMQLVREIEVGMDVDGDAVPDLDPSRIYYVGASGGGRQGAIFLAVEPSVRAGVLTVPNGSIEERLSARRGGFPSVLQSRIPSVINPPGITSVNGIPVPSPYFNENLPLRDGAPYSVLLQDGSSQVIQSPNINTVPGAMEIQQVLENIEWVYQSANSVTYASFIRRHPLNGVQKKAVIIQFAYGDRLIPNPSTTALLRVGDLADRATFFRTDLRFAVDPTPFADPNLYPHVFMSLAIQAADPNVRAIALQAQEQIASFFALDGTNHSLDPFDGTQITDPDGAGPIFEVPVVLPLPITLNYFP